MAGSIRCAVCETKLDGRKTYVLRSPDDRKLHFCPDGNCLKEKIRGIVPEAPGVAPGELPTRDVDEMPSTSEQAKGDDVDSKLDAQQAPSIQEQMDTLQPGERARKGDPERDKDESKE